MKKIYLVLFTAAMATTFAACSKDDAATAITSYEEIVKAQPVPVTFGTYLNESATTRAGYAGNITTDVLGDPAKANGFGVFAYYTNGGGYPASNTTLAPNFMYNQHVSKQDGKWFYTPLKYWPNETNATNGTSSVVDGSATSAGGPDKLSFFAYAPYVPVGVDSNNNTTFGKPTSGSIQENSVEVGITALSTNTTESDPTVSYTVAAVPANTVDLLWAVSGAADATPTVVAGTTWNIDAGKPFIDLTKPKLPSTTPASTPINFTFKHALAKLTFSAQAAFDAPSPGDLNVHGNTRIVIQEVSVNTGFHKKGVLNLNNTVANTPNWATDGEDVVTFTITDDIIAGDPDEAGLKYSGTDTYDSQPLGVTKVKQYLMDTDAKYFTLIPEQNKSITVTITYHVFTADPNLSAGFVKVTNVITKEITGFNAAAGNWYNINMVLGMESVSFTATVTAWPNSATDTVVDLPINVTPNN